MSDIEILLENLQKPIKTKQQEAFNKLEKMGSPSIKPLLNLVIQANDQHLEWIFDGFDYEAGEGGHRHDFKLLEDTIGTDFYYLPAISKLLIGFGDASIPELIELLNHERSLIREWSALLLGEIGDAKTIPPLMKQLQTHFHEDDSLRVIEALGKLHAQEAVDKLIELLEHNNPVVGSFAATALGEIGDTKAISPLVHRLKRNLSVYEISAALHQIGTQVVPSLLEILKDKSAEKVHDLVLMNLYMLGDKQAIEPIIQYLDTTESPALKSSAIIALGYLKAKQAVKPISNILEDTVETDSDLHRCAARALGIISTQETFEALIKVVNNGNSHSAALAFGEMESVEDITPLLDALNHKEAHIRTAIVVSLGNLGDKRAIPALTELMNDTSQQEDTRHYAAWALGKISGSSSNESK